MGVGLQKSPFLRARREGLAGTLAARNVGRPVNGLASETGTWNPKTAAAKSPLEDCLFWKADPPLFYQLNPFESFGTKSEPNRKDSKGF